MNGAAPVLTALGMVNALGNDTDVIWRRLQKGDQTGLALKPNYLTHHRILVGPVKEEGFVFPKALKKYTCRNNLLSGMAFKQIKPAVQAAVKKYGRGRIGVVMGSSTSGMASAESAYASWRRTGKLPSSFHYVQHEMGGVSEFLAALSGVQGPAYTLSTACSSSAKVFASARALLRDGWCDAVLVGGSDSLCRLTVQGFSALGALSEEPCNSLSRNRKGFNIGEGAAIFMMEPLERGVRLLGVGESSDGHHISAPDPDGKGAYDAMQAALKDAKLDPADVDYLNLHGTGTVLNDQMESRAVSQLFKSVPVSSTKGMTGHTLGAAGAMEVGFCYLALHRAKDGRIPLPPHCWDGRRDKTLPSLSIVARGQAIKQEKRTVFLSNSFGFGGSNCSVLIGSGL